MKNNTVIQREVLDSGNTVVFKQYELTKTHEIKKFKPEKQLLFNSESLLYILAALDKKTNKQGFIEDIYTKELVLNIYSKPILSKDLIGILDNYWITDVGQLILISKLLIK